MQSISSSGEFRAEGISARLGSNQVLDGLDLPILHAGRLVALLGPNGCGKSTLLKSIAGLVHAHHKVLRLDDQDLLVLPANDRAKQVRYLPQSLPDDVHLTVMEAILVAINARRSTAHGTALNKVQSTLADLGIAHLGPRYLDELSGGQKQLVGLAQALSHEPKVLLLDEPLASLDLNYQHHVMQLLIRLTQERKMLTLIVLHDLNSALRYADLALLMRDGALVASGVPDEVITPGNLAKAFSIQARIETCSQGRPYVLVDDLIHI
ncbi:MAG TPA: ABC transporter ATP-binding protein [Eoetvoesiella sp.]